MTVRLALQPGDDDYPLTSFIASSAIFINSDGTTVAASGTVASSDKGLIQYSVPGAVTAGLLITDAPQVEISMVETGQSYYLEMNPPFDISGRIVS